MMFNPSMPGDATADPVRSLATRIATRLSAAGGAYRRLNGPQLDELAHAVAWNWWEETGRADAAPVEWLPRVCRALSACGESEMAGLLMLFDTQLIRPATWTFHGDQPFWILDGDRLVPRDPENLALLLQRALRLLIERMAPLWDAGGGSGVLGVRHGSRLAAALDGADGHRRRGRRALQTLRQTCEDQLTAVSRRRGWIRRPDVILIDP